VGIDNTGEGHEGLSEEPLDRFVESFTVRSIYNDERQTAAQARGSVMPSGRKGIPALLPRVEAARRRLADARDRSEWSGPLDNHEREDFASLNHRHRSPWTRESSESQG
jgi:hypothetical protein